MTIGFSPMESYGVEFKKAKPAPHFSFEANGVEENGFEEDGVGFAFLHSTP
jgi:hypothetical protein